MLSKYLHARLKCGDDRFASDLEYVFQELEWMERNAVAITVQVTERKQFQTNVIEGCL